MKIAVVGSGVSGLVATWLLQRQHDVELFESDHRVGGHVHTVRVPDRSGREFSVDTGFIVFNESNYPLFTRLLERLGVESQPSEMSFSVRCDRTGLEYNGSTVPQLYAQRRNLLRPGFHRMVIDILRFNRKASRDLATGFGDQTLRAFLSEGQYTPRLAEHYLVPMGSALWSMPPGDVLDIPMEFFARFFDNHGMLTVDDRPEWRVVRGGSDTYVRALIGSLERPVRTGRPVRRVTRHDDHVSVDGDRFDQVVLACHGDDALALLGDPSPAERSVLGAFTYRDNQVCLHTDVSVLPRRRRAWGAWNYHIPRERSDTVRVSYDMNRLQSLAGTTDTFCVTLNGAEGVNQDSVLFQTVYRHPQYTLEAFRAQARYREIGGRDRTHFCGAYWGFGFHEDGVRSAVRVADDLGVKF